MGEATVNLAIRSIGYSGRITPHGLRATASTILNEQGWRPDAIERQLAHAERNKVRANYHRSEYLADRRAMMQAWADYLDALCDGANVVPLRA
jgi:integrase